MNEMSPKVEKKLKAGRTTPFDVQTHKGCQHYFSYLSASISSNNKLSACEPNVRLYVNEYFSIIRVMEVKHIKRH